MAKNTQAKVNINLSSRGKRTIGKVFYAWAINSGRAIIILIELVALGALAYRFVIDRQIVDLQDQIQAEESAIIAQAEDEKLYRSIQSRLDQISRTDDNSQLQFSLLNEVTKAITEGTIYQTNFSINGNTATIDGATFSVLTLSNLIDTLKKTPTVSEISVSEVNTTNLGVNFKITIKIAPANSI